MPAKNGPATPGRRVLNRWSDDLDKGVLLCVQYACSEAGLKIPWSRVAALMGPTFTEGGIVQHLAKLRQLMAKEGIPVPPSVKRGMVTKSPSKIYGSSANPRVKFEAIAPMFPEGATSPKLKQEEDDEEPKSIYRSKRSSKKEISTDDIDKNEEGKTTAKKEPTKSKAKGKGKTKGRHNNMSDEEDDEPAPDFYDSDADWAAPKKRRRTSNKAKKKQAATKASAEVPAAVSKEEDLPAPFEETRADEGVAIKVEDGEDIAGPATRTRGIKRDYSMMAAPSSDEVDPEDEEMPQVDRAAEGAEQVLEEGAEEEDEHEHVEHGDVDDDGTSSEASTEILDPEDVEAMTEGDDGFAEPSAIADLSYGQIMANPRVMAAMARRFQTVNTGNIQSFGGNPHGHVGVGIINRNNSYSGNQLGYSGAATMNSMSQVYSLGQFPSMSMYDPSSDSSRNSSIVHGTNNPTFSSMSNNDFLSAYNFGQVNAGDVVGEQDHMNSMPNGDVFFTAGDYLVDDA